jgi:hypothetical protein
MNIDEFRKEFRKEFSEILPNTIWHCPDGNYEVFDRYMINPQRPGFQVWCYSTCVGTFSTTKSALSWCIADKFRDYNLSHRLLSLDNALANINADIAVRAQIAERSKKPDFRESISVKLESKIINKKTLENQLDICINLAKYLQHRGFDNETARIGRGQPNKTSR